jgi:hypothetical protein
MSNPILSYKQVKFIFNKFNIIEDENVWENTQKVIAFKLDLAHNHYFAPVLHNPPASDDNVKSCDDVLNEVLELTNALKAYNHLIGF